jgi:hypothetical protein
MFIKPLHSNGHGADHIENSLSIVEACLPSRCLAIDIYIYVTIFERFYMCSTVLTVDALMLHHYSGSNRVNIYCRTPCIDENISRKFLFCSVFSCEVIIQLAGFRTGLPRSENMYVFLSLLRPQTKSSLSKKSLYKDACFFRTFEHFRLCRLLLSCGRQ